MKSDGKKIITGYFYNPLSFIGAILAVLVLMAEFVLFGIDFYGHYSNLYLGLGTYLVLPPFLILGILMIFLGFLLERRKARMGVAGDQKGRFIFDFSQPQTRNTGIIIVVAAVIFMIMTAIGTYKAFHYTESVAFCGLLCHEVMKPEYVAYQNSPHARVKCVDCHIGAGAGWYVRSKISGARQVVKTLLNSYERPIPVPVHNLRPAKETCEECHWPGKSFGNIEQDRQYYSTGSDGQPAHWTLRMLMHVSAKEGNSQGIHAHMSANNKVSYVASDEKRQVITWIRSVNDAGVATVYTTKDSPYKNAEPPQGKIRQMDCMDCHTRPSHHYEAPMPLVNRAIAEGRIDPAIPLIKDKAVAALARKYSTEDEAVAAIRTSLLAYYKEKQAPFYTAHEKNIQGSVDAVVDLFKHNMFPEMKVRWDVYPDNIGHMISPGCFRCHDGEHQSNAGKVVTRDCRVCHAIIAQGPADNVEKSVDGLPFRHPFDGDESWKEMNCADCHSGS